MIGKLAKNERELFRTRLEDLINPKHELAMLAQSIDWQYFEDEFKSYYSDKGAPSRYLHFGCKMFIFSTLRAAYFLSINFRLIRVILFIFAIGSARMELQKYFHIVFIFTEIRLQSRQNLCCLTRRFRRIIRLFRRMQNCVKK